MVFLLAVTLVQGLAHPRAAVCADDVRAADPAARTAPEPPAGSDDADTPDPAPEPRSPSGPLDDFEPTEKIGDGSQVAFPADI